MFWSPRNRDIDALMAFGGGALLAALTIDLVGEALERDHYYQLAVGCLIGGLLFVSINKWINSQGGFLRKVGSKVSYLSRSKSRDFKRVFKRLSRSHLFNALPPEQMKHLVPLIERQTFQSGHVLLRQGNDAESLYIIDEGEVKVIDDLHQHQLAVLGPDDVVGEISLLTGSANVHNGNYSSGWEGDCLGNTKKISMNLFKKSLVLLKLLRPQQPAILRKR